MIKLAPLPVGEAPQTPIESALPAPVSATSVRIARVAQERPRAANAPAEPLPPPGARPAEPRPEAAAASKATARPPTQEVARPAPVPDAAKLEAARLEAQLQEQQRRQAATLLEAQRVAEAQAQRLEAQREEATRLAAQQETQRQEAAKVAAAQQELARLQVLREEAARVAAAQETARQDSIKQSAARQAAAQQEAERQDALRQEAAREQAAAAEKAAARQQLDARTPLTPPEPVAEKPRRRTLIGRPDQDDRLGVFAEAWSQRVQQNADFEFLAAAKSGAYTNPIVSVTLRADGSLDGVVFKRSSGIAAIDDAIRIIIASLAPYSRIPSELALDYDVVEVSRLWSFGSGLRLTKTGR